MRNKWTLIKCCLMLCISMILCGSIGLKAEAREANYARSDWHLIDQNMQPVDEIVVHEGESLLFYMGEQQEDGSYIPDPTYYVGGIVDWHFSVYPFQDDYQEWYENENIKVWQPTVHETSHVYVKGLRATDSDDNYYLFYIDLNTRIPITVLPAEPGVIYPTYPESPTDIYYTLDDAYEYIRQMTRNHVQENYYFYIPEELEEAYGGFRGAYGFYTSQAELKPDEGDYMDLSGFGSYGTSPDGWTSYRDTDYTRIEVRRAGYIFNTTVEQERTVDAKIASLFGPGGALAYTKTLQPHEQVKACMDYIMANVTAVSSYESIPHSAYGALIEGKATCQGFALTLYRFLRELGIPNRIVMVDAVGAHTFNLVLLNGKYYYCDANTGACLQGSNTFGNPVLQSTWRDDAKFVENIMSKVSATDYDPSAVVYATDLTVDKTLINFSAVGESAQVFATVTPADAVNREVVWSSSDPSVITVDSNGVVTAVGDGVAGVVVKTTDSRKAAVCMVVVSLPKSGDDAPVIDPAVQEQLVRSFVERMYTIVLNRDADAAGVEDWTRMLLNREVDGALLANGFVNSDEFVARNLDAAEYVSVLYRAFLNREADAAGIQSWVNAMNNGASRQSILDGFIYSDEFAGLCDNAGISPTLTAEDMVRNFVRRMYTVVLNRAADASGLEDWTQVLLSKKVDGATLANGFVNSDEFVARNLSNEEYIGVMYQTFLNRPADEGGMQTWLAQFAQGATRQEVMNGFVNSAEFDRICDNAGIIAVFTREDLVRCFVERMYTVVLNRPADQGGLNSWTANLMSGLADGATIGSGFINSEEFAARNLCDSKYIDVLYRTFLNRSPGVEEMASWLKTQALGATRTEILRGFICSDEFSALCAEYGIARGNL